MWLAAELGMFLGSLFSRLTGRTMPDTEDIDAIASALGMSGFELLVSPFTALERRSTSHPQPVLQRLGVL